MRHKLKATRITASLVGIYAGVLGAAHGIYEIQQGSVAPDSVLIEAIGSCKAETVAHACLPAMTLVPDLRVSGVLAVLVGVMVVLWAGLLIERRRGPLVLGGLAVVLLLVGGGFLPPLYGLLGALVATQIHRHHAGWGWMPSGIPRLLAWLWPWLLGGYFVSIGVQLGLREMLNDFLLDAGAVILPLEMLMLIGAGLGAVAHDRQSSSSIH